LLGLQYSSILIAGWSGNLSVPDFEKEQSILAVAFKKYPDALSDNSRAMTVKYAQDSRPVG